MLLAFSEWKPGTLASMASLAPRMHRGVSPTLSRSQDLGCVWSRNPGVWSLTVRRFGLGRRKMKHKKT